MKRTAFGLLIAIVIVAATLLLLLERSARQEISVLPLADRIAYLKLYVDMAKAVLVGVGAASLGILIPAVFAEARYSFERLRDSRVAYSEAKTSVDYLPLRLCTLDLKAASVLVQRAHVRKHEAELYPELKFHLKRRGIDRTPEQWGNDLFERLYVVRKLLEAHADDWDSLTPPTRLIVLQDALKSAPPES
jgi:hypothetical protein